MSALNDCDFLGTVQIKQYPLPHFNDRPEHTLIDTIVIHSMYAKDSRNTTSAVNCFKTLDDNKVSSHFSIDRQGLIWQHVSCAKRAWHAGKSSLPAIDYSETTDRENFNDFSIGIELIGVWGQRFKKRQYRSLNSLLKELCRQFPIRIIISHQRISPDRKNDPGPSFRWDIVKRSLNAARLYPKTVA